MHIGETDYLLNIQLEFRPIFTSASFSHFGKEKKSIEKKERFATWMQMIAVGEGE